MDVIIDESSDSEDCPDAITSHSFPTRKVISLIIAFLPKLRVAFNISDCAVKVLLQFFKFILVVIGTTFSVPELRKEMHFSQSIHGCYSFLELNVYPFKEYILCPACHMLYGTNIQPLVLGTTQTQTSAKCSFVEFPSHPQQRFRLPCSTSLLNQVQKKNHTIFKPRKVY